MNIPVIRPAGHHSPAVISNNRSNVSIPDSLFLFFLLSARLKISFLEAAGSSHQLTWQPVFCLWLHISLNLNNEGEEGKDSTETQQTHVETNQVHILSEAFLWIFAHLRVTGFLLRCSLKLCSFQLLNLMQFCMSCNHSSDFRTQTLFSAAPLSSETFNICPLSRHTDDIKPAERPVQADLYFSLCSDSFWPNMWIRSLGLKWNIYFFYGSKTFGITII